MKIAEISAFSSFSVGKIMSNIEKYINDNTKDVCRVFFARGNSTKSANYIKISNKLTIDINVFFARIFDNDGFCLKNATELLIKKLNEYKPDIVHIHCLHGYYLNSELLFSYLKKNSQIKVVWTMHDTWAITGHCCFSSKINCEKWVDGCFNCQLKHDYPTSLFFDNSKKNYEMKKSIFNCLPEEQMTIICPSLWMEKLMKRSILKKYNILTIYNGIDLDTFNETPSTFFREDLSKKKKILLAVASVWDERKGLDFLLQISKKINNSWQIIIIGKLNKKITFPDNIEHIERTANQEELKFYYQKCNLLINPTSDDNYPTVNLEAQACGAKVLSFDTGGCSETNAGNLYLASFSCIDELIEQIYECDLKEKNEIIYSRITKDQMCSNYYNHFLKFKEN